MTDAQIGYPQTDTEDAVRRAARQRAEMLQGLYIHILVFVVVNIGLFVINWLTRGADGGWWFQWPAMMWSLGLAIHVTTVKSPFFSAEWVDRKADELARRG